MKLPVGESSEVKPGVLTPDACAEITRLFWQGPTIFDAGYKRHTWSLDVSKLLPPELAAVPSFVAGYRAADGAELPPHNDGHDGCTMSVLIGSTGEEDWPLIVDGHASLGVGVGDGVLYRARLDHWRDPMPVGLERYTVMMFSFIPAPA